MAGPYWKETYRPCPICGRAPKLSRDCNGAFSAHCKGGFFNRHKTLIAGICVKSDIDNPSHVKELVYEWNKLVRKYRPVSMFIDEIEQDGE